MKKDPQNHWFMMVQSNMMKFEWFGGIPDFRKPPHGEIQVRKKINCLGFSVPRRLGKGQSNGSSCEASRLHRLDVWEPTSGSVWWKVADCSAFKGVLFRKKKKNQQIHVTDLYGSFSHSSFVKGLAQQRHWGQNARPRSTHMEGKGLVKTLMPVYLATAITLAFKKPPPRQTPEAESGSHLGIHQPEGQGLVTHNGLKHQIHGLKKWFPAQGLEAYDEGPHVLCS